MKPAQGCSARSAFDEPASFDAGDLRRLIGSFGAEDAAVLDVIFGRWNPTGTLPFELPRSMDAVRAQKTDVPYDSGDPLFALKFGLSYS